MMEHLRTQCHWLLDQLSSENMDTIHDLLTKWVAGQEYSPIQRGFKLELWQAKLAEVRSRAAVETNTDPIVIE
jgi:hypothetical protein